MFEQTFKTIGDVLRHESGCMTELARLDARYVFKEVGGIRGGG